MKSAEPRKVSWGCMLQVRLKVTEYKLFLGTARDLPCSTEAAPSQMDAEILLGLNLVHDGGN